MIRKADILCGMYYWARHEEERHPVSRYKVDCEPVWVNWDGSVYRTGHSSPFKQEEFVFLEIMEDK